MSYVVVLLLLLFYVYGVIATDVFGKAAPEEFGSIWSSAKNLLFITFEGWSWIYDIEGIQKMLADGFPEWILALFFVSFLFVAAMIFLNLFIGIITSDMATTKEDEKRGKSKIMKKGHTLILGWSPNIFKVIEELIEANENKERAFIVILADYDKSQMEFEISEYFFHLKTTHIICRSGSPADISNLKIVSAWDAKSIIIIKDDTCENYEVQAIKSIIALIHDLENASNKFHIIAEMEDEKMIKVAKSIGKERLIIIKSYLILSKLISQCALQPNLSKIYTEITKFQGNEIYLRDRNSKSSNIRNYDYAGKKFSEVLFDFKESCPIGVFHKNECQLNPSPDYIFYEEDQLLLLAKDDSAIKYSKVNSKLIDNSKMEVKNADINLRTNFLVLGSNHKLPIIITEIHSYLFDSEKNGTIVIVTEKMESIEEFEKYFSDLKKTDLNIIKTSNNEFNLPNLNIQFIEGNINDENFLESIIDKSESIIILSYFDYLQNIQESDSITLVCLFHLREIGKKRNLIFSIVAEMIDDSDRELVDNPNVSDFIISSNITSSIMSQLSEEPLLDEVYGRLFTSEGSELYTRNAKYYIKLGIEVSFATIVQSAIFKNETVIGFMIAKEGKENFELFINPKKDLKLIFKEDDLIIVLAEK
jgi:Trk K+ transport system NAD-binding subunit